MPLRSMKLKNVRDDIDVNHTMLTGNSGTEDPGPDFPYGLKIDLNNESLALLGIKDLPKIGDIFKVVARVEVSDTSESESNRGDTHRNVGLQITEMVLEEEVEKRKPADIIFGDQF